MASEGLPPSALFATSFLLPMLDLVSAMPDTWRDCVPLSFDLGEMVDALDLAPTASNALAVGWSLARGEFDGLRVDVPVRMAWR